MSKSEVYSWRLDSDLKRRLEEAARNENTSVGGLLDRIARDWLGRQASEEDEEALQWRLHADAARVIGTIQGDDPGRSQRMKESFHQYVLEKHRRRASKRSD
jgi:predicted transcriptional regulator